MMGLIGRRQPVEGETAAEPEGLNELPAERALRWNLLLTWFMRVVALAWIAKGLLSWATIIGLWPQTGLPFEAHSVGYQATVIYFAIIDLVAAVGLWLTSVWGGVLWLLAVMSHLILAVFFPRIVSGGPLSILIFSALIVSYLAVSWLAASDE